jgi:AraC-like DNA-binding protein
MSKKLELQTSIPNKTIDDFVDVFWMLSNNSDKGVEIASLPDGKVDLVFISSHNEPLKTLIMNLDKQPFQGIFPAKSKVFAVSFKLLALEYILETSVAKQGLNPQQLADNFWGINESDLTNFENLVDNVSEKILAIKNSKNIENKKSVLFDLIYASNGAITVKELSEKSCWSSREINRYFSKYVGVTLKAYCNILRFKASLPQIKEGNYFPEQNFADQNHFIREVKKYSGITPKELNKNENDRFVLLVDFPKT